MRIVIKCAKYQKGDGTGASAGQVAGALINFDPASTDTGQKVWNDELSIITNYPMPLKDPTTGSPFVYKGITTGALHQCKLDNTHAIFICKWHTIYRCYYC